MRLYAIVPVKPLASSKLRLSRILGPKDRARLVITMLSDVLNTLRRSDFIEASLVISKDEEVKRIARDLGALFLYEPEPRGLNVAIRKAVKECLKLGAEGVLIIHADVPLVNESDLRAILRGLDEHEVVIAPSLDLEGTNALALTPPDVMPVSYGPGSFYRHLELALKRHLRILVYFSRSLALDVDRPRDLALLAASEAKERASVILARKLIRTIRVLENEGQVNSSHS